MEERDTMVVASGDTSPGGHVSMDEPFAQFHGENEVGGSDGLEGSLGEKAHSEPRSGTSAPSSTSQSPRSGHDTAKEESDRESMKKVSDILRRRASDAVMARRASTFRITKDDAEVQTSGDLPSVEECLYLREVHNRVRQFSSLLQLWLEDPEEFDFVGEWAGTSLDEESQREAQEAFADEEASITAMQEEIAALLTSTDVPNDDKVEALASISDRQKLIFLRRVRRMQEIAAKEKAGRKLKFLEMNQQSIDDDYTENNLFVRGEVLATSCVAHLGKIFVFLRAMMQQGKISSSDGIFADIFPGGQKQRTVLGLGNLPGEIDDIVLPRDLGDLKDILNFHELPSLMKLKYTSVWNFGTEELEQMKLIFLQRYCHVNLEEILGRERKVKDTQTELVDVVSIAERKRREAKLAEAQNKILDLQREVAALQDALSQHPTAGDGELVRRSMSPSSTADVMRSVARDALEACSSHGSPITQYPDERGGVPPLPGGRSSSPTTVVPVAASRPPSREVDLGIGGAYPKPGSVDTAQIMMQAVRSQMRDLNDRLGQEKQQVNQLPSRGNTPPVVSKGSALAVKGPHAVWTDRDDALALEQSDAAIVEELLKNRSTTDRRPRGNQQLPSRGQLPSHRNEASGGGVLVVASPTNACDPDLEQIRIEKTHQSEQQHHDDKKSKKNALQNQPAAKGLYEASGATSSALAKRTLLQQPDDHGAAAHRQGKNKKRVNDPHSAADVDEDGFVDDRPRNTQNRLSNDYPPDRVLPTLRRKSDLTSTGSSGLAQRTSNDDHTLLDRNGRAEDAMGVRPEDEAAVGSLMLSATAAEQIMVNAMIQCRTLIRQNNTSNTTADSASSGWLPPPTNAMTTSQAAKGRPDRVRMPDTQVGSLTGASDRAYANVVKLKTKLHPNSNDGHPPHRDQQTGSRGGFTMAKMLPNGPMSSALVPVEPARDHVTSPATAFVATPIPRSVLSRLRGTTPPLLLADHASVPAATATNKLDDDNTGGGGDNEAKEMARLVSNEAMHVFSSLKNRLPPGRGVAHHHATASPQTSLPKSCSPAEPNLPAPAEVDPIVKAMIDKRSTPTALAAPQFSYVE